MFKKIWNTYMVGVELLFVYLPLAIGLTVCSVISAAFLVGKFAVGASIVYAIVH